MGRMNIQKDTSVLQVEWLVNEHAKLEVGGSSAGGWEAREKSRGLWRATVWLPIGVSPSIKKIMFFQPILWVF